MQWPSFYNGHLGQAKSLYIHCYFNLSTTPISPEGTIVKSEMFMEPMGSQGNDKFLCILTTFSVALMERNTKNSKRLSRNGLQGRKIKIFGDRSRGVLAIIFLYLK